MQERVQLDGRLRQEFAYHFMSVGSFSNSQKIGPAKTVLTGWALKRKLVTTPKFPAAAQRPKQIIVLRGTRSDHVPVGQYDIGLDQVVDGQTIPARKITVAAPEREDPYTCG